MCFSTGRAEQRVGRSSPRAGGRFYELVRCRYTDFEPARACAKTAEEWLADTWPRLGVFRHQPLNERVRNVIRLQVGGHTFAAYVVKQPGTAGARPARACATGMARRRLLKLACRACQA